MKVDTRRKHTEPTPAAPVPGLIIASAAAALISLASPAVAQSILSRSADGAVSIDLSVLNALGAPRTVPQVLQPSVRSLLMPNASDRPDVQLQQLVPPDARTTARPAAPRMTAPSRPAPTRMARPIGPTTAPMPAPALPPAPPIASDAPRQLPKPPKSEPMPLKAAPEPPRLATSHQPSGGAIVAGSEFRLSFESGGSAIRDAAKQALDELAGSLKSNSSLRLQLMAYAGGDSQTASQARRLSLSRGLAVRKYLIDKGISDTRIVVRALGSKFESGPSDRVDIVVTAR